MKKAIMFSTAICVLCFVLGVLSGWHGCMSYNRSNKIEIVKAQHAALDAADKVMDNNQLFDTDGSDAMVKYLDLASKVDSLYKLENQGLCSSLSKILSKTRSQYTWDNCTRKLLERAVGALECVYEHILVHAVRGAYTFSLGN